MKRKRPSPTKADGPTQTNLTNFFSGTKKQKLDDDVDEDGDTPMGATSETQSSKLASIKARAFTPQGSSILNKMSPVAKAPSPMLQKQRAKAASKIDSKKKKVKESTSEEEASSDSAFEKPKKKKGQASKSKKSKKAKSSSSASEDDSPLSSLGSSGNLQERLANIKRDEKRHKKFSEKLGNWDPHPTTDDAPDEPLVQPDLPKDEPSPARGKGRAKKEKSKYTPLEQQYLDVKAQHPDVIIIVEHGYRYRFFGKDAEVAAKVLRMVAYMNKNFLNASFPVHRLHIHTRRLVQAGYKVGIFSQTETAALKTIGDNKSGPFTRALTALYTKATLIGQNIDPLVETTVVAPIVKTRPAKGDEGSDDMMDDDAEDEVLQPDPTTAVGHYIMCIYEAKDTKKQTKKKVIESDDEENGGSNALDETITICMVAIQTSTGDIIYDEFKDGFIRQELDSRLYNINPIEILVPKDLSVQTEKMITHFNPHKDSVSIVRASEDAFDMRTVQETIRAVLLPKDRNEGESSDEEDADDNEILESKAKVMSLINSVSDSLRCTFGALIRHLKEFSLESLFFLDCNYQHFEHNRFMKLDASTLKNLEVFENESNRFGKGTLFWVMNHTKTTMGRRLLIEWIKKPLMDTQRIRDRLDAVQELSSGAHALVDFIALFKTIPDIERGICRIYYSKCTINEFILVLDAFQQLQLALSQIDTLESVLLKQIVAEIPDLTSQFKYFFSSLNAKEVEKAVKRIEEPVKEVDRIAYLFKRNTFPKLDKCIDDIRVLDQEFDAELKKARTILGVPDLNYKTVLKEPYLIEVKADRTNRVPENWTPHGGTKTAKRFRTPFVVEQIKKYNIAQETLNLECIASWKAFLSTFASKYEKFRRFVSQMAMIDVLQSLSQLALKEGYIKPTLTEDGDTQMIRIVGGRHPMVEALISNSFVPNSIYMRDMLQGEETEDERVDPKAIILTGPNMGGKTSIARQIALITLMAQIGSFVPAEEAVLSPLDGIFTRMGAHDDMASGKSTFFVELLETSRLLSLATSKSMVILDELGRGTSTHDGVAIAYATLKYLTESVRPWTLFITHYPSLSSLSDRFPKQIASFHMSFVPSEDGKSIVFLYQLTQGVEGRSYGLNVAKLASIPNSVIKRAEHFSHLLEKDVQQRRSKTLFGSLVKNVFGPSSDDPETQKMLLQILQKDLILEQKITKSK